MNKNNNKHSTCVVAHIKNDENKNFINVDTNGKQKIHFNKDNNIKIKKEINNNDK